MAHSSVCSLNLEKKADLNDDNIYSPQTLALLPLNLKKITSLRKVVSKEQILEGIRTLTAKLQDPTMGPASYPGGCGFYWFWHIFESSHWRTPWGEKGAAKKYISDLNVTLQAQGKAEERLASPNSSSLSTTPDLLDPFCKAVSRSLAEYAFDLVRQRHGNIEHADILAIPHDDDWESEVYNTFNDNSMPSFVFQNGDGSANDKISNGNDTNCAVDMFPSAKDYQFTQVHGLYALLHHASLNSLVSSVDNLIDVRYSLFQDFCKLRDWNVIDDYRLDKLFTRDLPALQKAVEEIEQIVTAIQYTREKVIVYASTAASLVCENSDAGDLLLGDCLGDAHDSNGESGESGVDSKEASQKIHWKHVILLNREKPAIDKMFVTLVKNFRDTLEAVEQFEATLVKAYQEASSASQETPSLSPPSSSSLQSSSVKSAL